MLHPSYKDAYFKDTGWPSHWIKAAQEMLDEEFKWSYQKDPPADDTPDEDIVGEAGLGREGAREAARERGRAQMFPRCV